MLNPLSCMNTWDDLIQILSTFGISFCVLACYLCAWCVCTLLCELLPSALYRIGLKIFRWHVFCLSLNRNQKMKKRIQLLIFIHFNKLCNFFWLLFCCYSSLRILHDMRFCLLLLWFLSFDFSVPFCLLLFEKARLFKFQLTFQTEILKREATPAMRLLNDLLNMHDGFDDEGWRKKCRKLMVDTFPREDPFTILVPEGFDIDKVCCKLQDLFNCSS